MACTCEVGADRDPNAHADGCAFLATDAAQLELADYYDRIDRERKERFIARRCGFDTPSGGAEVARRRQ